MVFRKELSRAYKASIPRYSRRIFSPMRIRTMPPASSAFDLYLMPNLFPAFAPAMDSTSVKALAHRDGEGIHGQDSGNDE